MDVTRQSLLSAIKNPDDQVAWGEFYDLYNGYVRNIAKAASVDLLPEDVEDVVQRVFIEISRGKVRYAKGKGSFRSLLKTTTRRRCIDQLRRRLARPDLYKQEHRAPDDDRSTGTMERLPDDRTRIDEAVENQEWATMVSERAKRATKARVDIKQYQIFEAYVLREWEVSQVVETLGVTANQVYLAKRRVGAIYAEEVKRAAEQLDNPTIPGDDADDGAAHNA